MASEKSGLACALEQVGEVHIKIKKRRKMNEDKKSMNKALNEIVVPELRKRGLKGSFPHFRRIMETQIHLLTFQLHSNLP